MPFAQWHYPFENEEQFEASFPRRLHRRGRRSDAGVVLHPPRHRRARQGLGGLQERRRERAAPGRARREDGEDEGERRRSFCYDRPVWGRRRAVVHDGEQPPVGEPEVLGRRPRRHPAEVLRHARQRLRLLRHLRQHRRLPLRRSPDAARGAGRAGPVGPQPDELGPPSRRRRLRRLQPHQGRPRRRGLCRGALELVPSAAPAAGSGRKRKARFQVPGFRFRVQGQRRTNTKHETRNTKHKPSSPTRSPRTRPCTSASSPWRR